MTAQPAYATVEQMTGSASHRPNPEAIEQSSVRGADRVISVVWAAGDRRQHINEYRPDLYHPELWLVRHRSTVTGNASDTVTC